MTTCPTCSDSGSMCVQIAQGEWDIQECPDCPRIKRGRGRPPEGERIEVRIPAGLLERIERDAERNDISRAEQVRHIIALHYNGPKRST